MESTRTGSASSLIQAVDPDPTANILRYPFAMAILLKSPWVFPKTTCSASTEKLSASAETDSKQDQEFDLAVKLRSAIRSKHDPTHLIHKRLSQL
jgi:hypothetical protein